MVSPRRAGLSLPPTLPGTESFLIQHLPGDSSLTYDRQPGPWAEGKVIVSTSEHDHSEMHTSDPLSPTRSLESPGACLTYNRESGAFSKVSFSVHTVTLGKEENE